jgi:hypothetical protein
MNRMPPLLPFSVSHVDHLAGDLVSSQEDAAFFEQFPNRSASVMGGFVMSLRMAVWGTVTILRR